MERKKIIDLMLKILVLAVGVVLDTFLIIINSYKLDVGLYLYILLWLFGPSFTFIGILWLLPIKKIRKQKKRGIALAVIGITLIIIGVILWYISMGWLFFAAIMLWVIGGILFLAGVGLLIHSSGIKEKMKKLEQS